MSRSSKAKPESKHICRPVVPSSRLLRPSSSGFLVGRSPMRHPASCMSLSQKALKIHGWVKLKILWELTEASVIAQTQHCPTVLNCLRSQVAGLPFQPRQFATHPELKGFDLDAPGYLGQASQESLTSNRAANSNNFNGDPILKRIQGSLLPSCYLHLAMWWPLLVVLLSPGFACLLEAMHQRSSSKAPNASSVRPNRATTNSYPSH